MLVGGANPLINLVVSVVRFLLLYFIFASIHWRLFIQN